MSFDGNGIWTPTDWEQLVASQSGKEAREAYGEIAGQLQDPNEVHWRLYLPPGSSAPTVVCVQEFDYADYIAARFIEAEAYPYEELALEALDCLS